VVLIPGGGYPVDGPLLYFANSAADDRAAHVEAIQWDLPSLDQAARRDWIGGTSGEVWVCGQVSDALERVEKEAPGAQPVLIGKSLGTRAAPVAADRNLPAVWLTPLLRNPATVAALRRATAPFLLVGGSADASWDGILARQLTPHVVELPEADHGLFTPGPLAATLAAHAVALTALENFLDTVVWLTA
jgi:hypothetical protein